MKHVLGVIPARGKSKRLPKKNILSLYGKPLIYYTIKAAKNSCNLNRFIVSTEDDAIAQISESFGAQVLPRPQTLALDNTTTEDIILNIIEQLKNKEEYKPEVIVLLQPTSPLRTSQDIDIAIEMFLSSKVKSLISVTEYDHSPYWAFNIEKDLLKPEFGKKHFKRSQEMKKLYRPNGAIFIINTKTFLKYKSFYTDKITPFILPRERSIDIDDEFDFIIAEFLLKRFEGKIETNKDKK